MKESAVPDPAFRDLLSSEQSYARLLRNISGAVYRCRNDRDWTVDFASEGCLEITGYRPDELIGNRVTSFGALIHPEDAQRVWDQFQAKLMVGEACRYEYRIIHRNGEVRWVWDHAEGIYSCSGELLHVEGLITDITARKQAEQTLRESEALLAAIVNGTTDAVYVKDLQGRYLLVNSAAQRIVNKTEDEVRGRDDTFVLSPADAGRVMALDREVIESGVVRTIEEALADPTGAVRIYLTTKGPVMGQDGRPAGLFGVSRDITAHKRAARSLHELSRRLLEAEDEERRRIAKDLHDSTAQDLVAVMMNLGLIEESLPGTNGKALELLADSLALLENCANEIRTLAYVLHPPRLDESGLQGGLREYVAGFSKRAGIEVKIGLPAELGRLPEELELALFRVVQECLGNVLRHSGSETAEVAIRLNADQVVLEVSDHGRGLPMSETGSSAATPLWPGVGIASMRERLEQLGGHLELESSSAGTTVRAVLPRGMTKDE